MTTTKAYKGLPMEGVIASWYSKTTLKDINRHKLMAKQLIEKIPANGSVLEIAPGPGYFCIELAIFRLPASTSASPLSRSLVKMPPKQV